MIRQPGCHGWSSRLPATRGVTATQGSHRPAEIVAVQREIAHRLMHLPVLREAIRFPRFAGVTVAIRAVVALDEDRVDFVTDLGTCQRHHHRGHRPKNHAAIDRHDTVVLARLVHGRIGQLLGKLLSGRRLPTAVAAAPGLDLLTVDLQDGLRVGGVFVAGHQLHHAAFGPLMKIFDEKLRVFLGALAHHGTHDQAMLRVQDDVVPALALLIVVRIAAVAVLFLLADERPLFVELDLARLGGKRPRVRRGVAGPGRPPADRGGSRCPC